VKQRTLGGEVTLEGVGVHTGEAASVTLAPAAPNEGLRFRRVDLEGEPEIPVDVEHVRDTSLGTTLGAGEATASTVEHLLAALHAAGVDNALLALEGPEVPIRDGSFRDFADAIADVGVVEQEADARVFALDEPVRVEGPAGGEYVALPAPGLRISATIDFDHPAIGRQFGSFDVSPERFRCDLAEARTFGFAADAEELHARGLALGASLENTVVLDASGPLNEGGLRSPDEFVRHKAGDVLGDLALVGRRLAAHLVVERPSHAGNVALARALAERAVRAERAVNIDTARVMDYLPHRYPMLLVDRIVEFEAEKRIVGIKNVTINEPFFQGHFPGHPIMPGVLLVEAMAQVGGLLLMESEEDPQSKVVYFMAMDGVKFRRPVVPGDQVRFELTMLQYRRGVCRIRGEGRVDDQVVVEGELMARVMDR